MFIGIATKPLEAGSKAPDFSLPSASGEIISLHDYQGKRLLLFFFRGTWCPQCAHHMREIHRELAEFQKLSVAVLGISCQALEPIAAFLKKEKIEFPVLSDRNRDAAKAYGVYTLLSWDSIHIARPSFFYIDGEGFIRYRYLGNHQWDLPKMDEIKNLIGKLS